MTSERKRKKLMAAIVAVKDTGQRKEIHDRSRGPDSSTAGNEPSSELRAQRFDPADLLSYPLPVVSLEPHQPVEVNFEQRMDFDVTRGGQAVGVALWLHEAETDGIEDDHRAGAAPVETINGARLHVLYSWPAAVQVTAGDSIRLSLRSEHSQRGCDWHWDSLIRKIVSGRIQGIRYQRTTDSPLTLLNGKRR